MKIHMSNDTYRALCEQGSYKTTCRGEVLIKGKGQMVTYWLEDRDETPAKATFDDIMSENEEINQNAKTEADNQANGGVVNYNTKL